MPAGEIIDPCLLPRPVVTRAKAGGPSGMGPGFRRDDDLAIGRSFRGLVVRRQSDNEIRFGAQAGEDPADPPAGEWLGGG